MHDLMKPIFLLQILCLLLYWSIKMLFGSLFLFPYCLLSPFTTMKRFVSPSPLNYNLNSNMQFPNHIRTPLHTHHFPSSTQFLSSKMPQPSSLPSYIDCPNPTTSLPLFLFLIQISIVQIHSHLTIQLMRYF